MESILEKITDWLREMLVSGIMGNLSGMFESVNQQVGEIAAEVGRTPANFSPGVFAMIRNVSESVIVPVAGIILTFIACYELIQLLIDHAALDFPGSIPVSAAFRCRTSPAHCPICCPTIAVGSMPNC